MYHFGIWILEETFKWALKGVFCSFANFYFISSDLENAFNSVCVLHNLYFSIMNVLYLTCITNHLSILHNMLIVEVKWLLFLYSYVFSIAINHFPEVPFLCKSLRQQDVNHSSPIKIWTYSLKEFIPCLTIIPLFIRIYGQSFVTIWIYWMK